MPLSRNRQHSWSKSSGANLSQQLSPHHSEQQYGKIYHMPVWPSVEAALPDWVSFRTVTAWKPDAFLNRKSALAQTPSAATNRSPTALFFFLLINIHAFMNSSPWREVEVEIGPSHKTQRGFCLENVIWIEPCTSSRCLLKCTLFTITRYRNTLGSQLLLSSALWLGFIRAR